MIEEYKPGKIIILGTLYEKDVEVYWTGEVLEWQREDDKIISFNDIKRAADQNPDTIVIGAGEKGGLSLDQEIKDLISGQGIKLIVDKTEDAVKTFNVICEESEEEEGEQDRIIGLFHL